MVNYYTTIQSILNYTRMFFDILIMWLLLYYTIKIVRNNSRTIQIFKGIVLILVIKAVANIFGLNTVGWIADMFVSWGFIAVIIIFQPEIRSLLEKLGKSNVFSRISTLSGNEKEHLVDELVKAVMILSKDQTGALISLEQSHSLNDYVKTGTPMNSMVTAELLTSIFGDVHAAAERRGHHPRATAWRARARTSRRPIRNCRHGTAHVTVRRSGSVKSPIP